ncbi:MAG: hypothetical protein K0Q61_126 [Rhodococcus erythropolis]|nr:hypothetical protein [Rhodococcus erythropolis]
MSSMPVDLTPGALQISYVSAKCQVVDRGHSAAQSKEMTKAEDPKSAGTDQLAALAISVQLRRRVNSTNLFAYGSGALLIGLVWMFGESASQNGFIALVVPLTFGGLWAATAMRSSRLGVRGYRIGYGVLFLLSLAAVVSGLLVASSNFGALTLLSVGFFWLGWRERSQLVWGMSAFGFMLGLATSAVAVRQIVGIVETTRSMQVSAYITTAFAVVVIATAVWSMLDENQRLTSIVR